MRTEILSISSLLHSWASVFSITTSYHFVLTLTLLLFLQFSAQAQIESEGDEQNAFVTEALEDAYKLIEEGQYEEARTILDEVLAYDSTTAHAHFLRGVSWARLDSSVLAATDFIRSAELDTTDGLPHLWLADLFLSENMPREAIGYGLNAVTRLPENAYACDVLSRALLKEGYDSLAMIHSRRAVALDSTTASYHGNLALTEMRVQDYPAALHSFSLASALEETNPTYAEGIGVATLALGRWSQARAALERCIVLGGDSASCLGMLGVVGRESGDSEYHDQIMAALNKRHGSESRAIATCAYAYANMARDLDGALKAAEEALVLDGRDVYVIWAAGFVYGMRNDATNVCRMYRRLAGIDPDVAASLDERLGSWPRLKGLCADETDDFARARALYSKHLGESFTDQGSGLTFPPRLGVFDYMSMYIYPEVGRGVSFRYESDPADSLFAVMTVYLYPAPPGCFGHRFVLDSEGNRILTLDTTDSKTLKVFQLDDPAPSFEAEYNRSKREVESSYSDAKLLFEGRRTVNDGNAGPIGLLASYSYMAEEGYEVATDLFLFTLNDYFVKIRISYPKVLAWDLTIPISDALDALRWPQ